jgi:hypothetical protein
VTIGCSVVRVYVLLSRDSSCHVRACRAVSTMRARRVSALSNRIEAAVRPCIPIPRECTDWLDRPSQAMAPAPPSFGRMIAVAFGDLYLGVSRTLHVVLHVV